MILEEWLEEWLEDWELRHNIDFPKEMEYTKKDKLKLLADFQKNSNQMPEVLDKIAKEFNKTEDYEILKDGYDWLIDKDGYLWCLTAGDLGYDKTNFKLDTKEIL